MLDERFRDCDGHAYSTLAQLHTHKHHRDCTLSVPLSWTLFFLHSSGGFLPSLDHPAPHSLPHPQTIPHTAALHLKWRSTLRPPNPSRPLPSPSPCPHGPTVVSRINFVRRCASWGLSIVQTAPLALRMAAQVSWPLSTALAPRVSRGRSASKEQRSK